MEDFILTPKSYIEQRVDDQINWHSSKAKVTQTRFRILSIIEISAAASIPFLAGYISTSDNTLKVMVGMLGVIIAVASGLQSLFRFQELWISTRYTSEALLREKNLFLTKAPPYEAENSFSQFVQRIENILSEENTNWKQVVAKSNEKVDVKRTNG
jgi:hypothetical protein